MFSLGNTVFIASLRIFRALRSVDFTSFFDKKFVIVGLSYWFLKWTFLPRVVIITSFSANFEV